MDGALDGIRILDLTSYIAGPFATMLLGDLGAEIIKIEQTRAGDMFRAWDKKPELYSPLFRSFNRNKKSFTLDLRSPEGNKIFFQLAQKADVIVENFRPGVVGRLGIDYAAVAKANPRIIYCSISAFGQTGPYNGKPGYDTIGQALSGLLSILTDLSDPTGPGAPFSDHLAGIYGCYGILAALMARERTGKGQKVETSLLEATLSFIGYSVTQYLASGQVPTMTSRLHEAQVYAFVAGDGLSFVIHLSHPKKFWEGLVAAIGRTELRDDARFENGHARERNYDQLSEILKEIFRHNTRDYWLETLERHDVPCAPIRKMDEVFSDPQVRFLDRLVEIDDAELGSSHFVKNGVTLSETPAVISRRPPTLGENNREILTALGYSDQDIDALISKGVV
jgi:formyl-CoA transferase